MVGDLLEDPLPAATEAEDPGVEGPTWAADKIADAVSLARTRHHYRGLA